MHQGRSRLALLERGTRYTKLYQAPRDSRVRFKENAPTEAAPPCNPGVKDSHIRFREHTNPL